MAHKTISVIISVYNVEEYISTCIESVIQQSFSDIEIIIVNDQSKDNSGHIIETYVTQDERIIYIEHEKNAGVGATRNTGITHATGTYIYFVDGDDFLHQDAIQCLYNKMQGRDDIDVVVGGFIPLQDKHYTMDAITQINIDKSKDKHFIYPKDKEMFTTEMLMHSFGTMPMHYGILPPLWNKLYKKSVFTDNNITILEGVHTEDLATTPKILLKAQTVFLSQDALYFYRLRDNSALSEKHISLSHIVSLIDSHIQSIQHVKHFFIQEGCIVLYRDVLAKMISSNLYQIVNNPHATKEVRREALALFFEYCAREMREEYSLIDEILYGDICFHALLYPNIQESSAKRWLFFSSLSLGKKVIFLARWILISPKHILRKKMQKKP